MKASLVKRATPPNPVPAQIAPLRSCMIARTKSLPKPLASRMVRNVGNPLDREMRCKPLGVPSQSSPLRARRIVWMRTSGNARGK